MNRSQAMLAAGLALAMPLGACKGGGADPVATSTTAIHPESHLPVIPLTVAHAGQTHSFRVELAQSRQEQARGLMFRTQLAPDEGMLFPFDPPKVAGFWMKDTVIPLDLVFIAPDGRITNVAANARPYDETPLKSAGLVKAVLEIPGGRAAQLGLEPGDTVAW